MSDIYGANFSATAVYTTSSLTLPARVGDTYFDKGARKRYRFCQNKGATSWTIRVPVGVYLTSTTVGECSFTAATQMLIKEGGTDVTAVVGIALGTIATTEAGWVQCGGLASNLVVTDGNVDAEEGLYVADNGIVSIPVTEPTHVGRFAVAATPDSGGAGGIICSAWLDNCFWR
jgi:hypothetical protein